jgi:hypothetical protein
MSSSTPKVTTSFSNGNIVSPVANIDGFAAFIGTGFTVGNLNKVFIINNTQEAEALGITALTEPRAYKEISDFYTELGASQKSYWLLVANTVTMTQMLDITSLVYGNKLIKYGKGDIAYLGVFRTPPNGYDAGANYIDADVPNAVAAAKVFCQGLNNNLLYTRIIIEGRISDETSTNIYTPKKANNGYVGVALGNTISGKSSSVGLVLGRKVKYACHIKLGKTANGSLSASKIFIGTKELGENGLLIPAVVEVLSTSTLTITNKGTDDDYIDIYSVTPVGNWIYLGYYKKVAGDATTAAVATAIAAAINANTANTGYAASVAGSVVTISAPLGSGDTLNTGTLFIQIYSFIGTATMAVTKTAFANGVTAKPERYLSTDELHSLGYISYVTYPNKAGFYFGIDNMASDDDFKILVHGALIDAVAKVATDVYINDLEGEVDTNEDGTIKEIDAKHLEDVVTQRVNISLADRLSGFIAEVNRTVNIIETSKTRIKLKVRPKGYNTFIEIEIGLTAGN